MADEEPKDEEQGLIANLRNDVDALMKQNEMLLQVVDKKLLAQYYAKNSQKLPKEVKLNMLGDRVVIGWMMKENKVFKDPLTQRWQEIQTVLITLEADEQGNEKIVEMPYTTFIRDYTQTPARILKSEVDEETDALTLKVARLTDGKEYSIDVRYVN